MRNWFGPVLTALLGLWIVLGTTGCAHRQQLIEHLEWVDQRLEWAQIGNESSWSKKCIEEAKFEVRSLIWSLKK